MTLRVSFMQKKIEKCFFLIAKLPTLITTIAGKKINNIKNIAAISSNFLLNS